MLGIGGGLGIVLSGAIVEHLSYHWLFWLPLVVVVVATVATHRSSCPSRRSRAPGAHQLARRRAAVGLARRRCCSPSARAPTWGWGSPRTLGLFALAAVVARRAGCGPSRARAEPLVDMRMMRLRPVWTTNLAAFLLGFGMFARSSSIPQFVQLPESTGFGFGASVTQAGPLPASRRRSRCCSSARSPGGSRATVGSKVPLVLGCARPPSRSSCSPSHDARAGRSTSRSLLLGVGIGLAFALDGEPDRRGGAAATRPAWRPA